MNTASLGLLLEPSRPEQSVYPRRTITAASWCAILGFVHLTSTFNASPVDCVPPPAGIVAWWPGNGTTTDIAGTNHGTLVNGATFAPGYAGQAFSFDGVNDQVQVPSSPSLSFAPHAPMTVELWAYRTSTAPVMHLIGKRVGCDDNLVNINYQIGFNSSSGQGLTFGANSLNTANSGLDMPTNAWTHLAGTFDGSTLRLYVNGALQATRAGMLGSENSAPLLIGASGTCARFGGLIDEATIYDRALSAEEIAAVYAAGSAGKCGWPTITRQPQSQLGFWGKSVTFTVSAVGEPPLTYQWQKDTLPLAGETGSALVLSNLQVTNAGAYAVLVTNSYGRAISSNAYLTINPAGVSLALYPGLTIDGVPGLTYGIQYTTDLSNTNGWLGAANVTLLSATAFWFDIHPAYAQPQRYYRVVPGPISIP